MGQAPDWPCPSRGSRVPLPIKVMAMTTPTTPIDLSLDPPRATFAVSLPGLTYAERAFWAIGVRATEPFAEFSCEAWFRISIGDQYFLYVNDQPVANGSVTALGPRYFLTVLGTRLLEGLCDVYLQVVRASGQVSRSPTEKYLVKKTQPAGIDRRPDIFGHDGLSVMAEGLSEFSSIDRYIASTGMWAVVPKYANARVNDRIQVWLDGVLTERRLSAAEADGPGPYRVFIPADVFSRISQSGAVALIVTVIDVAGNTPFGNDIYSAPFKLYSELSPGLFDPAVFLVGGIETTYLNLQTQSNLPFSVAVTPPRSLRIVAPPNQIVLTLILIRADGTKQTLRLPQVPHTRALGETIPIANRLITEMGPGFLQMSYEVFSPAGARLGEAGRATVTVVGVPVLDLLAPSFEGTRGPQTINGKPYETTGAIVTVAYARMSASHIIRPKWRFPNGTYATLASVIGNVTGFLSILISPQIIAQSAGMVIDLSYEVTTETGTFTSESQVLTFQNAQPTVPPLVLDVTTFGDYEFNGWQRGEAVSSPRDLVYTVVNGRAVLLNNTYTSQSAGVVLKKRFTNMQVGATYLFSVNISRWTNDYEPPIGSLRTSQGDQSTPTTITTLFPNAQTLSLAFVARSQEIECQYFSHQATGVGNDYVPSNFRVQRM